MQQELQPFQAKIKSNESPFDSKVRIAILGDQGIRNSSVQVLKLVKDFNADLLVHTGDFDYQDKPLEFVNMLKTNLGPKFPILVVPGNHDILQWFSTGGYKELFGNLAHDSGIADYCTGELGIKQTCVFGNIVIVLSGIGTLGTGHLEYLESSLQEHADLPWKFCIWHKNQHLLQTGDKPDEVGYQAYGSFFFNPRNL